MVGVGVRVGLEGQESADAAGEGEDREEPGECPLEGFACAGAMRASAVPMAMDCGQIILPMPAPITFAAASRFAGTPSALAAPV